MDRATANLRHRRWGGGIIFPRAGSSSASCSDFCRGETQPAEKNGETKSGRLTELSVEQCDKTRAEQNDRKRFAITERAQTEPADANGERDTPQRKSRPSTGPFSKSTRAHSASERRKPDCPVINLQPAFVPIPRPKPKNGRRSNTRKPFDEIAVDAREQTAGDGSVGSLGRFGKAAGQNCQPFVENRHVADDPRSNDNEKQTATKLIHCFGTKHQNNEQRQDNERDGCDDGSASGNCDATTSANPDAISSQFLYVRREIIP